MATKDNAALHIYALGRFSVVKGGIALAFERKAQKRPIELLKVIVAYGGRNISRTNIEDILWPASEMSLARQSFDTTLYRLRKLIGADNVLLDAGKLSLNPTKCWVDVWAFEQKIQVVDSLIRNGSSHPKAVFDATCEALDLLQGSFLIDEAEQPWTLHLRDKIRLRAERQFRRVASLACSHDECDLVMDIASKALEVAPYAEEFCLRLMNCYAAHRRYPEALATFKYFERKLNSVMGVPPSEKAQEMFRSLLQRDRSIFASDCIVNR